MDADGRIDLNRRDCGNTFLCTKWELPDLLRKAEAEKERILKELPQFLRGDIGIDLHPVIHTMGRSIAATLTVNGEAVKDYDPADLCFLELNELMLKRFIEEAF